MNKLDLIILLPIAMGFVFGLFKGLIKEITSFAAILIGLYGAKLLSPLLTRVLISVFGFSEKVALPFSYVLLFVGLAIAMLVVARSLEKVFESLSLGGLNKLLGGIVGALKYGLIVSVLLVVFNAIDSRFSLVSKETKESSVAYSPMLKLAPALWDEAKNEHLKMKVNHEEKVD